MTIAVLLGLCIGLCLGALGGGGSIITVPALVYLLHQPLSGAITQSLVIVGISSATAAVVHARHGQVRWRAGLALGAVGGVAAWAGTALGHLVPADVAMAAFAGLMIVVAAALFYRSRNRNRRPAAPRVLVGAGAPLPSETEPASPPTHPSFVAVAVKVVVAGVLIGVLTGFFGVGGGFIIVPVLVAILGYSMPVAVGTSLLVITINAAVALLARAGHVALDWSVVLPVTIAAILGAIAGKYVTQRLSERLLTRSFAVALVAVAWYVGAKTLIQL
ncbi:sulfite exporter TauE/SafE family protein [Mycolicibacterium sp. XJ870]